MVEVLLVIHLLVALALVFLILIQRSEGGALGIGGGGMMSARGTANFLTRATGVLATIFILISIAMTVVSRGDRDDLSVIETVPEVEVAEEGPTVPDQDSIF
jgi:preprotein translocase subunit SecG